MCPNLEERQQQGFVNIVRKGVNRVIKTDEGYQLEDEYARLSPIEKLRSSIARGALDLHLHTNASDGFDSPPEVLKRVMQLRLNTFSITDHDTLWGVRDVQMILGKLRQMRVQPLPAFIPGVELSLLFEGQEVHLLGYFPSGGQQKMTDFLEESKQMRIQRNKELCEILRGLGFPITIEELNKEGGQVIGRVHVAILMVRRGFCTSIREAFERYLGDGKPAYIERDHPPLERGLRLLLDSGGIAVLAHPALYGWVKPEDDAALLEKKLLRLQALGCQGVEVIHGETSLEQSEIVARVAKKLGLLRTIGSDFHGLNKKGVRIFPPDEDYSAYLLD